MSSTASSRGQKRETYALSPTRATGPSAGGTEIQK